jgi:predicted amino acid-binding ACT domain protein
MPLQPVANLVWVTVIIPDKPGELEKLLRILVQSGAKIVNTCSVKCGADIYLSIVIKNEKLEVIRQALQLNQYTYGLASSYHLRTPLLSGEICQWLEEFSQEYGDKARLNGILSMVKQEHLPKAFIGVNVGDDPNKIVEAKRAIYAPSEFGVYQHQYQPNEQIYYDITFDTEAYGLRSLFCYLSTDVGFRTIVVGSCITDNVRQFNLVPNNPDDEAALVSLLKNNDLRRRTLIKAIPANALNGTGVEGIRDIARILAAAGINIESIMIVAEKPTHAANYCIMDYDGLWHKYPYTKPSKTP